MAISSEVIETEALSLPLKDRARLVVHLLESLDEHPKSDPKQMEGVWISEANRRYQAYLRGEERALPAEEVFEKLRADDH